MSLLCLSACVTPPGRVDASQTEAKDKSYTVNLPVGWIREFGQTGDLMASRDGYLLPTILIEKRPLKTAFAKTKKDASESMLPSELAERAVAELKVANEQMAALTVLDNEPAVVSEHEGFRLKVSYKNQRGLEVVREVVGLTDRSSYIQISYTAPKLYYYDKYKHDFDSTVESFKLQTAPAKGGKT
jgi:hypothetical protein